MLPAICRQPNHGLKSRPMRDYGCLAFCKSEPAIGINFQKFSGGAAVLARKARSLGCLLPLLWSMAAALAEQIPESTPALEKPEHRDWSIQFEAAFLSENNIEEIITAQADRADGDAAGQLYSIAVNWTAYRFEIPAGDDFLTPQFEPYARFTLVDETNRSLFPDYNAGIGFRWVDFPWNRWVDTTFFVGVGFSYSSKVYTIDRVRHPGEHRSHLKFDWPLQLTFALPAWPRHQFVLFNDHQSGGHFFDEGGVNSLGVGYRLEF